MSHDPELCKWLAEKVMGWHIHIDYEDGVEYISDFYYSETNNVMVKRVDWDPCCNPTHTTMLIDKVRDSGRHFMIMSHPPQDICEADHWIVFIHDGEESDVDPMEEMTAEELKDVTGWGMTWMEAVSWAVKKNEL